MEDHLNGAGSTTAGSVFFVGLEKTQATMTPSLKTALHALCEQVVATRIAIAKEAMDAAQAAANAEGKSSAGDKYETGRAMMQLERDQHARALAENLKLKQVLDGLDPTIRHEQVRPGSLVQTSTGTYYISISLGKLEVAGETFVAISPVTPLASMLMGLKAGDKTALNNRPVTILQVE
jgi:transcription elongation GreA/GreB family factor